MVVKEIANISFRLMLICAVSALVLSVVSDWTEAPIAAAARRAEMEAVAAVLPPFDNSPDSCAVSMGEAGEEGRTYYVGTRGGSVTGVAVRSSSKNGYGGVIDLMVGVDGAGTVTGVRVLRHSETPGLGANYTQNDLIQRFYVGRRLMSTDWRVKQDGGDIDAVTGATITGRAVAEALHSALRRYDQEKERLRGGIGKTPLADGEGEGRK